MSELHHVRGWADALIRLHLDESWSFAFDNAKRRAGLCDYTRKRITVSRYLAARYDDDEIHQVLLHEIAHALAGSGVGHGPKWKTIARDLGYVGRRTHDGAIADELAPWVGQCPAGHEFHRYRKPTRPLACGQCGRGFDARNVIEWRHRVISSATRRSARSAPSDGHF